MSFDPTRLRHQFPVVAGPAAAAHFDVGLAPYSDEGDVDRLITGLNAVAGAARLGG